MDHRILHIVLRNMELEIDQRGTSCERKRWLVMVGTYLLVSFVCSLRGNEGLLVETRGLINHIKNGTHHDDKRNPHGNSFTWPFQKRMGRTVAFNANSVSN